MRAEIKQCGTDSEFQVENEKKGGGGGETAHFCSDFLK